MGMIAVRERVLSVIWENKSKRHIFYLMHNTVKRKFVKNPPQQKHICAQ